MPLLPEDCLESNPWGLGREHSSIFRQQQTMCPHLGNQELSWFTWAPMCTYICAVTSQTSTWS